jgi:hypothetical protein
MSALPVAAWIFIGFPGPAWAQSVTTTASATTAVKATAIEVLPAVLMSILTGAGGTALIDRILRGDNPPAVVVARRAAAIIRQLGALRSKLKPGDLLGAVDRVVHVAARSLSYASVMRMAVADNYRPESAVLAWDFGPSHRQPMPGFERVIPDDKRLLGDEMAGRFQASRNSFLADGISGVRKIELDLSDGDYRIILMTRNVEDPGLATLPFGGEVRINGVPLIVNGRGPANWLDHALLDRSGVRLASGAFDRAGGFLTGNVGREAAALFQPQQGGAIVLEGSAQDGKLVIELRNFGTANSYLTGLIVEPPDKVSDLMLSRSALESVIPLDVRVALETEILLVAAETVQGIAPAAGQAFESETVVTAN